MLRPLFHAGRKALITGEFGLSTTNPPCRHRTYNPVLTWAAYGQVKLHRREPKVVSLTLPCCLVECQVQKASRDAKQENKHASPFDGLVTPTSV